MAFGLAVVALSGCERLQPPQIKAETVTIGKITPAGADLEAALSVFNPNKASLTASNIQSSITLGGKSDVAKAVITDVLTLPGNQTTKIKLPIHIDWTNAAAINDLAATKQPATYSVTGTVSFTAGKGAALSTPFQVSGIMSADELARAAGKAPR
jgi:LEA14-like dessication related protein